MLAYLAVLWKEDFFLIPHLHHALCMRAATARVSLCICTDSPEPSLLINAIRTEIQCAGSAASVCFISQLHILDINRF